MKKDEKTFNIPVGAHVSVSDKDKIEAGTILAKIPRSAGSSGDITGGLPRVTEMFEASTLSKLSLSERKRFLLNLPKKRLIEPEEIATIVHFLSCSLSSVLHGSVIDASMGLGVRPGLMSEY